MVLWMFHAVVFPELWSRGLFVIFNRRDVYATPIPCLQYPKSDLPKLASKRVGLALLVGLTAFSIGAAVQRSEPVRFVDVTAAAGIRFHHDAGHSPEKYLVETMGSGCAFLDYDQDGLLDIFFVNGGPTPAYQAGSTLRNALYHSRGDGTFTEVTEAAGIRSNA